MVLEQELRARTGILSCASDQQIEVDETRLLPSIPSNDTWWVHSLTLRARGECVVPEWDCSVFSEVIVSDQWSSETHRVVEYQYQVHPLVLSTFAAHGHVHLVTYHLVPELLAQPQQRLFAKIRNFSRGPLFVGAVFLARGTERA